MVISILGRIFQDQVVVFKPDDLAGQATGGATQNMGALAMPCGYWNTKSTQVLWQTKWTVNGLSPIRPVVVWNVDHTLDGKTCLLVK